MDPIPQTLSEKSASLGCSPGAGMLRFRGVRASSRAHSGGGVLKMSPHAGRSEGRMLRVILLDLQGPVFLSEPPYKVEFSNNSGGVIDCTGHGSPAPDVTTTNHELVYTLPNGSLIFYPFSADKFRHEVHSTVYSCHPNVVTEIRECPPPSSWIISEEHKDHGRPPPPPPWLRATAAAASATVTQAVYGTESRRPGPSLCTAPDRSSSSTKRDFLQR
ncbi:hypothetical protein AND_004010 [Anopheles darlingi]|uniref:Uncharacterized protein n=1 Tax=Anopheles darlingi TaxID=43151 RepID=W5JMZ2_ANODA|nr:hypothetical protein AND_004010 [Anopheles darlingi]